MVGKSLGAKVGEPAGVPLGVIFVMSFGNELRATGSTAFGFVTGLVGVGEPTGASTGNNTGRFTGTMLFVFATGLTTGLD